MTYTINPNAKNVWIRDNEDTMDLSPITDASSVYLENGRTIEQELGEGSMVSNVATVDASMTKVIDGTLDGAYESCVFKGRTLVNLVSQTSLENSHFTDYTLSYIDKTRTYLIKYESSKPISNIGFIVDNTTWNKRVDITETKTNGYVTIKPNESLDVTNLRVVTSNSIDSYTLKIMLLEYQEGMENWDIPYFEGMCDVKMPILRNVGKNLLNPQSITYTLSHTSTEMKMKNSLKPNVAYTISFDRNGISWAGRSFYVKGEGFSSYRTTKDFGSKRAGITFSLTDEEVNVLNNDDKSFIQLYSTLVTSESLRPTNIQIEESPTQTTYEDHKTNILHTSEEIVLRSLPSGVKDTYNVITGEYVKRIGEVVLDGSESGWSKVKSQSGINCFILYIDNFVGYNWKSDRILCDKLVSITFASTYTSSTWIDGVIGSVGNYFATGKQGVAIFSSKSLADFKAYLQSNPVTVQYGLATPITTTVNPAGVPFAYENGHVILESGYEGQSLLPTLEYSTVVNKTGQVQSIAKTIVKQETQITELEKMLVQSIIEMDYNNTLLTLNLEIDEVM